MTSDIPKQKVTIKYIEVRLIKRSKTTHGLVRNKDDANVMLNLRQIVRTQCVPPF